MNSTIRNAQNDRTHDGGRVVMFPRRAGTDTTKYYGNSQDKPDNVQAALAGDLLPGPSEVTDDERDRLTRLEVQFSHLSKSMDDTHEKVTIMHDLLMQAKGMRYLIVVMATVGGGISALAVKYIPFMRG